MFYSHMYTTNFQGALLQNQDSSCNDSSSLTSRSGADSLLPPLSQFFLHNIGWPDFFPAILND